MGEDGAAMVEFALVFPVQLLVFLLGIQLCLIIVGKHIVNYAAFCAARSYVAWEDPEAAAAIALIPIGGTATDGGSFTAVKFPGWDGNAPDLETLSQRAKEKLDFEIEESMETYGTTTEGRVVVRVRFAYEMMIPLANWVIYYGLDAFEPGLVHFMSLEETGGIPDDSLGVVIGGVPHIVLTERGIMPSYQRRINPAEPEIPHDVRAEDEDP